MITLKTLTWSNWFSYGENNFIDFENSTLTQVLGINGVGKTSIVHIVEEVLFNKNSKGVKKSAIMNRGAKELDAKLTFSVDAIDYTIKLIRKSTAKVSLYKGTEDISSHTATNTFKDIQKLIGMDFQTFSQLVYQNSKQGLEFLTSPDSARKKFLISLFNLNKYTGYYEVFKRAYNNINLTTKELEGKRSVLADWVDKHKDTDFSIKQLKDELDDSILHVLLSDMRNLRIKKENIEAENIKIKKNNMAIEFFTSLYKPQKLGIIPNKNPDLSVEQGVLTKDISRINKLIKDLQRLSSHTCTTCLQPIDGEIKDDMLFEAKATIKAKQDRLKSCKDLIAVESTLVLDYNKLKAKNDEYSLAESMVDSSLRKELYTDSSIDSEILTLKTEYAKLKSDIATIQRYNKTVNEHNTKLETILAEMEINRKDLLNVSEKLASANSVKARLNVLKTVFSTKGLVSYKIDFLVKDLQSKINEYLIVLSDGRFQLNFILQGDSIDISIVDNGVTVDISALSTGELSRVNVATLLAIRAMMSSISNTRINLLYLDEIIGVLDETGKANLIDILLNEKDLNTFIVSHEYTHPLLDKLYVTKAKGGSRID